MCENGKDGCCKKERNVKPGDCSPEQIQECPGSEGGHPCTSNKKAS
jgi:hypothetical protein